VTGSPPVSIPAVSTKKKVQGMLSMKNKKLPLLAAAAAFMLLATQSAFAQKKYDTGVTDTEIKVGNVEAYSGPASAYGIIGKTEEAYFKMINDNGGVNGRKINFISYDDGYSPPKTVEQVRKLIESDEVFLSKIRASTR
jgi:ABC-type branched-subunit amino acid transport system substrate-binding protein